MILINKDGYAFFLYATFFHTSYLIGVRKKRCYRPTQSLLGIIGLYLSGGDFR